MHHQIRLNSESPEATGGDLSAPLNVNRAGFFLSFSLSLSIFFHVYFFSIKQPSDSVTVSNAQWGAWIYRPGGADDCIHGLMGQFIS